MANRIQSAVSQHPYTRAVIAKYSGSLGYKPSDSARQPTHHLLLDHLLQEASVFVVYIIYV